MPFLTIFTPVYNRAFCISRLYESLCRQTRKDFEWIVVDDGSTDNIEELIKRFSEEHVIEIQYFRQSNGGKHRAINNGLNHANGDLFFIVDSDDYLTEDTVEWIAATAESIKDDNTFAGFSGIRITPAGVKIGGGKDFGTIDANALDIRYKYGVDGDLAEIYKTDILRQYPFPEFESERFCPEALIWNRIAQSYKLRYCYKGIYVCEYLPDGLTSRIIKIRRESPRASMQFYSELYHLPIGPVLKLKAAINFWRFAFSPYRKEYNMISPLSLFAWFPGYLMRITDKRKLI